MCQKRPSKDHDTTLNLQERVQLQGTTTASQDQRARLLQQTYLKVKANQLSQLFIQKLRHNLVLKNATKFYTNTKPGFLEKLLSQRKAISASNPGIVCLEIVNAILLISLLVEYSFALVFSQIENNLAITIGQIAGIFFFFVQMLLKGFAQTDQQGRHISYMKQTLPIYFRGDFKIDLVVWLSLVFRVSLPFGWSKIFRIVFLIKLPYFSRYLAYLESIFCLNERRELYWRLAITFLRNIAMIHILALLLNLVSRENPQHNWLQIKQLYHSAWHTRYVYGCYWAVNIMLTVGFGDFVATTEFQAICLIFFETLSCIILAYNISLIGQVLNQLRGRQLERNKHRRTFARICKENNFKHSLFQARVKIFIEKKFDAKLNFNAEQEQQTLEVLPVHLKQAFLKRINMEILTKKTGCFLKNLATQTLQSLALKLKKKICYPEEIVSMKGFPAKLHILRRGKLLLAHVNSNSSRTRVQQIAHLDIESQNHTVSVFQCIKKQRELATIISSGYSVLYQLKADDLESIIRQSNNLDYETYCRIRDQDSNYQSELSLDCGQCRIKNHTVFECPRLHYAPLKLVLIRNKKKLEKQARQKPGGRHRARTTGIVRHVEARELQQRQSYVAKAVAEVASCQQCPTTESELDRVYFWKLYFPRFNIPKK